MATLVFLWMVTLVSLTPAVGQPNLTQIRMVNLDQVHCVREFQAQSQQIVNMLIVRTLSRQIAYVYIISNLTG